MLIFYPKDSATAPVNPCVIIDALASDDRFSTAQIAAAVKANAPDGVKLENTAVFSCEYEFTYSHSGKTLGNALKVSCNGSIKSPPAILVSKFSPKWFLSEENLDAASRVAAKIANMQSSIVYAALVVVAPDRTLIARKFIVPRAEMKPDGFARSASLVFTGGAIEDLIVKMKLGFMLNREKALKLQLSELLAGFSLSAKFVGKNCDGLPRTTKFFPPSVANRILDEICEQNKLVFALDNNVVTFYDKTDTGKPTGSAAAKFSFLGSSGLVVSNFAVSQFATINFRSFFYDAQLFDPIELTNDAETVVLEGLQKVAAAKKKFFGLIKAGFDVYPFNVIEYFIVWSRELSELRITAVNNWLISQIRIDALLDAEIYKTGLKL